MLKNKHLSGYSPKGYVLEQIKKEDNILPSFYGLWDLVGLKILASDSIEPSKINDLFDPSSASSVKILKEIIFLDANTKQVFIYQEDLKEINIELSNFVRGCDESRFIFLPTTELMLLCKKGEKIEAHLWVDPENVMYVPE